MSITKRQNEILQIIGESTYVTVNELARLTYTSPSSIRRDLATMQRLGLVKRSHGGVGLPEAVGAVASFYNRAAKNVKEKRLIAKKAATLLRDGQSVFLDSSSTVGFLLPYLAKREGVTVFTNNVQTALDAIRQGIPTTCLGGTSVKGSVALAGAQTYKAIADLRVDLMFFSSQSLGADGVISDSTEEENFVRALMLQHADKTVFLCDSEKFGTASLYRLCSLDEIDYAVLDRPFEGLVTKATVL